MAEAKSTTLATSKRTPAGDARWAQMQKDTYRQYLDQHKGGSLADFASFTKTYDKLRGAGGIKNLNKYELQMARDDGTLDFFENAMGSRLTIKEDRPGYLQALGGAIISGDTGTSYSYRDAQGNIVAKPGSAGAGPNPKAFNVEPGVDPYWEEQARLIREGGAETLAPLRRLALGEDSIVARQTQIEREQIARGLQSEVAGQRGGYDPALQRAALMAGSQANVDLAARSAVGMAQEQVNADQAYDQAMTTRNIGALQALGYGVQQRGQQAASAQDLERLRMTAGQQAFQNQQTILDRNQRNEAANMQFLGSALTTLARLWGGPVAGEAADAATKAATQPQQQQNVAPPMGYSPAQQTAKPAGWWDPSRSQTSYLGGQSAPSSPTNPFGWQTAQKRSPLLDPYGR